MTTQPEDEAVQVAQEIDTAPTDQVAQEIASTYLDEAEVPHEEGLGYATTTISNTVGINAVDTAVDTPTSQSTATQYDPFVSGLDGSGGTLAQQQLPALDMTEARSRQTDLVNVDILDTPLTVIGAGAIGSFVVLTLAKMGFKRIKVYDSDIITVANISNQFYPYSSVGRSKVWALEGMIRDFERIGIEVREAFWERRHALRSYVIMAVDSMAVRHQIYKAIRRNADVYGFIDGRMGGQQAEVYSVDLLHPEQRKIYEQYLWTDSETSDLPCTQKAVMYNVLWIASMIANNLRLMLEEKPFHNVMQMDFENVNHINVAHT